MFKVFGSHTDKQNLPVEFSHEIAKADQIPFNDELSVQIQQYLSEEAENYIFIYGEYDTWSATAITSIGDANSRIFFKEGGSHRTRIRNLPKEQQEKVFSTRQVGASPFD